MIKLNSIGHQINALLPIIIIVGSPESVGFIEEADHGEQDGPNVLGGVPSLAGQLPRLGVVHRGVEDGDAEVAVLVYVGVPDLRLESESWWVVRVVGGKLDVSL